MIAIDPSGSVSTCELNGYAATAFATGSSSSPASAYEKLRAELLAQRLEQALRVRERPRVEHQEPLVADRHHVGVERARVDPRRVLLGEERLLGRELVQPRERLARLERLPRRELPGRGRSRNALRPQAKRCTGLVPGVTSRVWFAAPSSANWPPPGSGSCTAKCFGSAKIAFSTA